MARAIYIRPGALFGLLLRYTLLSDLPHIAGILFVIGLSLTPMVVIRNCQISLLVVEHQYFRIFLVTVCQPAVYFAAIVAMSVSGSLTLTAVICSYVGSVASSFLMTSRVSPISWLGSRVRWAPLAREALSASGAQISEIASYRLNQMILLPLIGGAALGNYAVAANIALAPAPIGHALGAVGFKDMASGTEASRRGSLEGSMKAAVWLAALSALLVSVIAPFIIPWAFGKEFTAAIPATIVLALGGFFVICNYVLTSGLVAQGETSRASYAHFSGFIVGLIALFALSLPFGLMGAAFASLLGFLATAVVASIFSKVGIALWLPRVASFKAAFSMILRK